MKQQLRAVEGKYEILEKISEGGMGAVYKVRHRLLERIRVIKVMRPHLVADVEMRTRFVREARLAGNLRHPNIAQVFDFAMEKDGEAFLVMEYVNGVTLQQVLKSTGPPSVGFTLHVVRQTLDALTYLHGKGVIHRDLSPDNIMVTRGEDGRPTAKLIDLGIAKLVESETSLTAEGSFIGKVRYASPELFKTNEGARVDALSDLYSMGLVLYEMLTGKHPMGETDVSGYIAGHLFNDPEPFSSSDPERRVPPNLRAVVMRTLEKEPVNRPTGAEALNKDLRVVMDHVEVSDTEFDRIFRICTGPGSEGKQGDTQERVDAQFVHGEPSAEATDLRALLDDITLDSHPSAPVIAPTQALDSPMAGDLFSGEGHTKVLPTGKQAVKKNRMPPPPSRPVVGGRSPPAVDHQYRRVVDYARGARGHDRPRNNYRRFRPWAEVRRVEAQDGTEVQLDDRASTPLRLEVAPGHYKVTLQRGEEIRELDLNVNAGATVHQTATFEPATAEDFFASVGLVSH